MYNRHWHMYKAENGRCDEHKVVLVQVKLLHRVECFCREEHRDWNLPGNIDIVIKASTYPDLLILQDGTLSLSLR